MAAPMIGWKERSKDYGLIGAIDDATNEVVYAISIS
jgi:hypothetical protein